jgi:prophage regulatory protein
MSEQLLRLPEVIDLVKKSRATIYLDMRRGDFPQSISIGRRAVAWRRTDLDMWLDARPQFCPLPNRVMRQMVTGVMDQVVEATK